MEGDALELEVFNLKKEVEKTLTLTMRNHGIKKWKVKIALRMSLETLSFWNFREKILVINAEACYCLGPKFGTFFNAFLTTAMKVKIFEESSLQNPERLARATFRFTFIETRDCQYE